MAVLRETPTSIWRSRDFRILFTGVSTSTFGDMLLLLVLGIWVKSLTGSNGKAGLTFLLIGLPSLASPLGGYLVDRVNRRRLLMYVNGASAVLLFPLLLVHDAGDVPIIYAVALGYGVSLTLIGTAMSGLVKDLLPDDRLAQGNGVLSTVGTGLRLLAPPLGAALFAGFGGGAVAMIDAGTFLVGAVALSRLQFVEPATTREDSTWRRDMVAGIGHLRRNAVLVRTTTAYAATLLVLGFAESIGFAVNDTGLHQPPSFIAVLVSLQGVGSIGGGLLASRIIHRTGESQTLGYGMLLMGLGFTGLLSTSLPVVLFGNAVFGVGLPLIAVAYTTLLQRETPRELMGRTAAATDVLLGAPQLVSIALGSALISVVDYRILTAMMVFVMATSGLVLLRLTRTHSNARGSDEADDLQHPD